MDKFVRAIIVTSMVIFGLLPFVYAQTAFVPDADNTAFRHEVIKFVRAVASHHLSENTRAPLNNLDSKWANHYQSTNWQVQITVYHDGRAVGHGQSIGKSLAHVLTAATAQSLDHIPHHRLSAAQLDHYRFAVVFDYLPHQQYAMIEYQQQGLELLGDRIVVRTVTREALQEQIQRSQAYLLRAMNQQWHGFFKFYHANTDQSETLLRTVYSSSSLYTLLQLDSWHPNAQLSGYFRPVAQFILSNQVISGPQAGGFYYAFDPVTKQRQPRVVVGTTAKTIFTLLVLHRRYSDESTYLDAAKKAGDWLLTMVKPNGQVIAYAEYAHGDWHYGLKQSLLYSGQVLSALSRLYAATNDKRYEQGAQKIADYLLLLVSRHGPLLGDEYRPANSISSSWVLMSLLDFTKIHPRQQQTKLIERIAQTILARQITNQEDAYNQGRYLDAMTASGNGWINEVMGNLYDFCQKNKLTNCSQYQHAMILSSRWLLQNAYTVENTYAVKNPQRAIGGFITNFSSPTVRTDAVCHGVNGLLALIMSDKAPQLLTLTERPFREILPLLRAGVVT